MMFFSPSAAGVDSTVSSKPRREPADALGREIVRHQSPSRDGYDGDRDRVERERAEKAGGEEQGEPREGQRPGAQPAGILRASLGQAIEQGDQVIRGGLHPL